ncbi:MAG: DNA polymerase III subunit delta [Mycoplasma sp.]|nr:DNA polymerase III subunit delta [Mycoplasma sp.]
MYNSIMFYFYGNEDYLIDKEIEEVIKNNENFLVKKFNSSVEYVDLINQISSLNLFDQSKILIFKNCPFLIKSTEKEQLSIIDALKCKLPSTIVIFTSEKINEKSNKNEIIKFLKNNAIKCIEFNELNNKQVVAYVQDKIASLNASISNTDLNYLLSKIPNKLSLIIKEIEKLVLLDKNISKSNIDDLIQKYDTTTAFDFINAFQEQDIEAVFKIYYEKLNYGESILTFINQIANLLETCSQVYSLRKLNLSIKEIENELKKHSFVIKKSIEFLNNVGYKKVKEYLELISDIDVKIKSGFLDEKIAFERFLLEIFKN